MLTARQPAGARRHWEALVGSKPQSERTWTECGHLRQLAAGPVIISPDGLLPSLYRELVLRRPHEFKIRRVRLSAIHCLACVTVCLLH